MPNGFGAVLAAMLITMFTFMGTEIVTIAAAESPNPRGRPQGRQLRHLADQPLLPGLHLRRRRPGPLELPSVAKSLLRTVLELFGIPGAEPSWTS